MKFQTILFDFDGVLCFDHFYVSALKLEHKDVLAWISKNIFEGNRELVDRWMRGEISSTQVNEKIATATGIDINLLNRLFVKSVEDMKVDENLLSFIQGLRGGGIKVGLVTDNMDVFSTVVRMKHQLDAKFDTVVNSADHGFLKKELNGKLLETTLKELGESDISKSLIVDNQAEVVHLYKQKGGSGFLYNEYNEFKDWIQSQ